VKSIRKFIACLVICFGAGSVGGIFTAISVNTWYTQLIKPEFTPPSWVFAPVWNFLYFLMAVSLYKVWVSSKRKYKKTAILVFVCQLLLNVAWSAAFFGLKSPETGFFIINILLVAIIFTIFFFSRISWKNALLLIPYLVWVSFASYLNYILWILNR
jgi:translocator protein